MKIRKIAAIISAAVLALTLTGCGNDPVDNLFNNPQNGQSGGTTSKPVESKPAESKPTVQLPDIPVNDASAFEYKYDSELGGMVITDYKLQSPKVHIPEKLENEKVVGVYFGSVNKDLTHIIMPESVKDVWFSSQIEGVLQFVNIPNGVTEMGQFSSCKELKSLIIGNGVTEIGDNAFRYYTGLTSIIIGNGVTKIGDSAFRGCTSLTSVTIGDSVTLIDYCAFSGCTALTSVTIPNSVTEIDVDAFNGCLGLISIDVADGNPQYCSLDGILCEKIDGGGIAICWYPRGKIESGIIIFPDSVTEIGEYAFWGCTDLTSITIPDRVTKIHEGAFSRCTSLTSVTIPDSVTEIGKSAFFNCTSLTSVTIPNGVTKIGDSAFNDCTSLTSVTIGDSVTLIDYRAFYGCTALTSVTIPNSATKIDDSAFYGCENIKATYKGKTYDYEHIEDLYAAINGN